MKKMKQIGWCFLFLLIGAAGSYFAILYMQTTVPNKWFVLNNLSAKEKIGYSSPALFESDIPLPAPISLNFKGKFIKPLNEEKESVSLGYIAELTIEKLDKKNIPEKYFLNLKREGNWESLPPTEVYYEAQLQIYLLDKDGFQLRALKPVTFNISSGNKNVLRDTSTDLIPLKIAKRIKNVDLYIYVNKCLTCEK